MIVPTSGISGYTFVQRVAGSSISGGSGSMSPLPTKGSLSNLTTDDRAVIKEATGLDISPEGKGLAPMWVHMIGMDRASGQLPAGQPLTTSYLHDVARRTGNTSPDSIQAMIDALASQGGVERFDTRT